MQIWPKIFFNYHESLWVHKHPFLICLSFQKLHFFVYLVVLKQNLPLQSRMVSTSSFFCYGYKFYFWQGLLLPITLHLAPHPSLHLIDLEILNIFTYLNILSLSFLLSLNFDFPGRMSCPWQHSISFFPDSPWQNSAFQNLH